MDIEKPALNPWSNNKQSRTISYFCSNYFKLKKNCRTISALQLFTVVRSSLRRLSGFHFIEVYRKCITSLIRTNSLIGTEIFRIRTPLFGLCRFYCILVSSGILLNRIELLYWRCLQKFIYKALLIKFDWMNPV